MGMTMGIRTKSRNPPKSPRSSWETHIRLGSNRYGQVGIAGLGLMKEVQL